MAERSMSEFYGEITKCKVCTNPDEPMPCNECFSRGFVAKCMGCDGGGQVSAPVAGAAAGTMMSTCGACGGTGKFGVKKPENWVEPIAETKKELATA